MTSEQWVILAEKLACGLASVFIPGSAHLYKKYLFEGMAFLLCVTTLYAFSWMLFWLPALALHLLCIYRAVTLPRLWSWNNLQG